MDNAAQRVRKRIKEWTDKQGHGSKKRLYEAYRAAVTAQEGAAPEKEDEGQSWVTGILNGESDLRLRYLDAVADLLGEAPGWLVRKPDRNYHELTMAEERLVKYYRALPEITRHNWIAFLDYLFRFQEFALEHQGRERFRRTAKTRRRRESKAERKPAVSE